MADRDDRALEARQSRLRASRERISRWLVASSRISTSGALSTSFISRTRACSPPESVPTALKGSSPVNRKRAVYFRTSRSNKSGRTSRISSMIVRLGSRSVSSCAKYPTRALDRSATSPASAATLSRMIRSSVVLPVPLGR